MADLCTSYGRREVGGGSFTSFFCFCFGLLFLVSSFFGLLSQEGRTFDPGVLE